MSASTPAVSVILPTRDRLPILKRAVACYEAQAGALPFEVVVTDDGSSDGTWDWLGGLRPGRFQLKPLRQQRLGPAAARNQAIREASGELLLFAGDDILPTPVLVEGHWSAHARGRARAVLGRTNWHPDEPVNALMRHVDGIGGQQFHYAFVRDGQRLDFRYFYASNSSLSRAELARVEEAFDPAFSDAAFEDGDLAYRLFGERREILYRSSLVAHHVHHHTLDSFCARQRRAGAMAAVFLRKHPEARKWFRYKEVRRIAEGTNALQPAERPGPEEAERFDALVRAWLRPHAEAERTLAWLEPVLIGLFRYEFGRGLAEAAFPDADPGAIARRLVSAHLRCPLVAALRQRDAGLSPDRRAELERLLKSAGDETALNAWFGQLRFRAELFARRLLAARDRSGVRPT